MDRFNLQRPDLKKRGPVVAVMAVAYLVAAWLAHAIGLSSDTAVAVAGGLVSSVAGLVLPERGPNKLPKLGEMTVVAGPDGARGRRFPIYSDSVTVGRSSKSDLQIPEDEYISDPHASIQYQNGQWYVVDLGSANGVIVNKRQIGKRRVRIDRDMNVRMGMSVLRMTDTGDDATY